MELVYFVIAVVVMGIVFAVLKKLWVALAMGVLGWKPRILDEKVLGATVKECTARFIEKCGNLRPEQIEGLSADEKRMMLEDMESYTRFVIESYVENYLMSK